MPPRKLVQSSNRAGYPGPSQSREQFFFENVVLFAAEEQRTVVMTTDNPELVEQAYQVRVG